MAIPYMFRRPETITQQSFAQEADRAAPMAILPYAEALGNIKSAPVTGPGDTTYLRQFQGGNNMRNALSAGLASSLGNIKTRELGQVLEAQRGQQSRRLQEERMLAKRYSESDQRIGRMLGQIPGQIAAQAMDIDEILIENTGESLGEVMKRQFGQDQLAAQALGQRLNERAMPSAPAPQSGVGLGQLRDAWDPNIQASPEDVAELEDIIRRKKEYEQGRLGGVSQDQISSLLQSGNDQDYLAGLSMLDAAEQALADEGVAAEAAPLQALLQSDDPAVRQVGMDWLKSADERGSGAPPQDEVYKRGAQAHVELGNPDLADEWLNPYTVDEQQALLDEELRRLSGYQSPLGGIGPYQSLMQQLQRPSFERPSVDRWGSPVSGGYPSGFEHHRNIGNGLRGMRWQ